MIPDIAGAIPGRRIEVFYYDAGTTHSPSSRTRSGFNKSRHPGLVPGSWLVPGPTQKGRDVEITPAGCFLDPEYRWGRFRDDGWEYR